ncbi:MAG: hypothetical protein K0S48_3 [Ramlibacter sp.]|jgi:hypothetical protein|nr:hypothetical protein [Ramlibacter sp.]
MSLDIEQRLKVFLASAPQSIWPIQTLEISHSAMTQAYCLWREPYFGTVTTESGGIAVQPVNFEIVLAGTEGHLDQNFEIRIDTTDIEDQFREEMDRIPLNTLEKIRCVYREYLSDDLTDMVARAVLEVESISYQVGAAAIQAVTPKYNMLRTGELYVPRECPTLRSFL